MGDGGLPSLSAFGSGAIRSSNRFESVSHASGEPFLSSRPSPRLLWITDRVKRYLQPGQRLLYEEGGMDLPGIRDPFHHGRFSGLLPGRTGVEVIGGPYFHASLTTNFTQFGEGKLFGQADWDRNFFDRYAKLYRPSAILCWSPHARRFCREDSDLVQVLEDDGTIMFRRIVEFAGDFIEGNGRVEATAGRIHVAEASPGLDGTVLLRYHFVPYLTTSPSVACEPEYREDDPVPFIRFRPPWQEPPVSSFSSSSPCWDDNLSVFRPIIAG